MSREEGTETVDGVFTRDELRQRATVLAPGIVLTRDVPKGSAESWAIIAEATQELGAQFEQFVMVLDLTEAIGRPRGPHWEMIKHTYAHVLKPVHIAVVQPGSGLMRSVLRFVLASVARESSVYGTLEVALAAARAKLEAAEKTG